jgi:hypothetical protein
MPAPPVERLKIRCYRCNQLLAVAPTKAGTVVACPKCKADLLIPRPDSRQPADEPTDPSVLALKSGTFPALAPLTESATATAGGGGSAAASSSYLDEIAAVIPPELAALRPEDLRVEAEFFENITRQPPAPAPADDDPFPFPAELLASRDLSAPPVADERGNEAPPVASALSTEVAMGCGIFGAVEAPPPLPLPQPAAVTAPVPERVVIPPIQNETSMIRPPANAEPRAIHQVVLPASFVLAWMMFVLAALPMAFLAGLMIGHFIWKTGP